MSNTSWKSSFCNSKSTYVSLSETSKYSMSRYEANKNTDREAHPAINFKRQLTNESAQRGTPQLRERWGNTKPLTSRSWIQTLLSSQSISRPTPTESFPSAQLQVYRPASLLILGKTSSVEACVWPTGFTDWRLTLVNMSVGLAF